VPSGASRDDRRRQAETATSNPPIRASITNGPVIGKDVPMTYLQSRLMCDSAITPSSPLANFNVPPMMFPVLVFNADMLGGAFPFVELVTSIILGLTCVPVGL